MATYYVRSTNGTSGDGLSWATAFITLAEAAAVDAPGDTVYVSHVHSESTAGSVTYAWAGTAINPIRILCVNDSTGLLAETALITTTGTSTVIHTGSIICHGVRINAGTGSINASISLQAGVDLPQYYQKCIFNLVGTNTGGRLNIGIAGNTSNSMVRFKDCHVKFSGTQHSIALQGTRFFWTGGTFESIAASPIGIFSKSSTTVGRSASMVVEGVDFSAAPASIAICSSIDGTSKLVIRNSRAPTGWTGGLVNLSNLGGRLELHNFDNADTNYGLIIYDDSGVIRTETSLVKTGGASDGTTAYSLKMSGLDTLSAYVSPLESPELNRWNAVVGTPITVSVDILHDSVTKLTDAEVWLEVQYLGTSGFPMSLTASDARASLIGAAVDQDVSTATWVTTGLTNPNKQKLSVTFTPQEAGYIHAKVVLAKTSKLIYIDPKLQVT